MSSLGPIKRNDMRRTSSCMAVARESLQGLEIFVLLFFNPHGFHRLSTSSTHLFHRSPGTRGPAEAGHYVRGGTLIPPPVERARNRPGRFDSQAPRAVRPSVQHSHWRRWTCACANAAWEAFQVLPQRATSCSGRAPAWPTARSETRRREPYSYRSASIGSSAAAFRAG